MDERQWRWGPHPNSLSARCGRDPELRKKFLAWREEYEAKYFSVQRWGRAGCAPARQVDRVRLTQVNSAPGES